MGAQRQVGDEDVGRKDTGISKSNVIDATAIFTAVRMEEWADRLEDAIGLLGWMEDHAEGVLRRELGNVRLGLADMRSDLYPHGLRLRPLPA